MIAVNRNKNRFSNVLPRECRYHENTNKAAEQTRVVLQPVEGEEGSDYINANWISVTNSLVLSTVRDLFQAQKRLTLPLKVLYPLLLVIFGEWFGR
jgi:protein tyrosine phosphatase